MRQKRLEWFDSSPNSRFHILYMCATMIREALLNINICCNYDVPLSNGKRKVNYVAVAALILVVYTLSLSMLTPAKSSSVHNNSSISNAGSLKAVGVGVYWDASLMDRVSSIDWGVLEPGLSSNKTIYIQNDGNSSVRLTLITSNWNPSNADQFIALKWDYGGDSIAPNMMIKVTLELAVSANVSDITDFSFDVFVVGA